MSAGGAIGAVVGGIIGFAFGGPVGAVYGAGIGFGFGMMVDPMTPDVGSIGQPLPDKLGVTPNQIGIPIPDLLGTGSIRGNLLFYGGERSEPIYSETSSGGKGGGGSAPKQVTGYSYYMSWGIGVCIGEADEIYSIWQDDKCIWSGSLERPVSGGQETIVIEDFGSAIISFGTQDQAAISSVGNIISDPTLNTPYRGLCWIYFDNCYIGKNNRMPSMRVVLRKTPELSFNSNNIVNSHDYNPAHAIWYIFSNLTGLPESWLNETNFSNVANALFNESRGLSILFGRQQTAIDYIESINAHIDGIVLYGNDGKFRPKLIRDDYTPAALPDIDESVLLDEPTFNRRSWIDTINETKVIYTEIVNPFLITNAPYVVGFNNRGQLGLGDNTERDEFIIIDGFDVFQEIACGAAFSAMIKSDGTLWTTGQGTYGQLGLDDLNDRDEFTQVGSDTWISVACLNHSMLAIKSDGTLWGTGYNNTGELGLGDNTQRQVLTQAGSDSDWHEIAGSLGGHHVIARRESGAIYGTGENYNGELGLGDQNDRNEFTLISSDSWNKIRCGRYHTLGIKSDGTLWACGVANSGQLGLGPGAVSAQRILVLTQVGSDTNWSDMGGGEYHSCAVKSDGTLWGTGLNYYGELGLGDNDAIDTFAQVPGTNWNSIGTGFSSSYAIKNSGSLWSTGGNYNGELGLGDNDDRNEFTQIGSDVDWLNVEGGNRFAIAIKGTAVSSFQPLDLRESTASPLAIDEGNIALQEKTVTKSIKLVSFTRNENAVWASRNALQKVSYPFAEIKCTVNRNLFRLEVGDCFYFSYAPYSISNMICRVLRIEEKDLNSEDIIITAQEDVFGITNVREDYIDPEDNTQSSTDYTIEPFDHEQIVESPYVLSGSATELIPMAGRKSLLDLGFYLYMSIDNGASYFLLDAFPSLMPYGTLVGVYGDDTYTIDNDVGFTIDFDFTEDADQYETTTFSNVLAGITNTAILGNEIISVQTITPDVDNKYILTDIIRGRFGTEKENHAEDTEFYFIHPNVLKAINDEIIPNVTRKFKLVPYNNVQTGDIADCSVIELSITGVSKTPYKPINFLANGSSFASRYTDDVVLTWSPRFRGTGAGIGPPGEVLADTAREGLFRIEVFVSDIEVRETTDIDAATWTYTEAMNLSDNVSLADTITFKLYNFRVEDGITFESEAVEVICKKE